MSDEVLIEEIRTAMRAEVDALEVPSAVVTRVLAAPPRSRLTLGWLMPALAVGVAAIVAVLAVTSLGHQRAVPHGAFSRIPVAARGLASQLGVLRRAQTQADVLPRWAVRETESLSQGGRVIGRLSRLVGAVHLGRYGRARVYLVVHTAQPTPLHPNHPEPPFLNPRLGDQATIAYVGPFREEAAINGPTVAAGGELLAATGHGLTAGPRQFNDLWGAVTSIVPDGVVRVKWVFDDVGAKPRHLTVWPSVRDNIALGRVPPRSQVYMSRAVWFGANGREIASFATPGRAAQARRLRRAVAASAKEPIASALVRHFALLRGSPTNDASGLSPAQVASLIEPNPLGLNIDQEQYVVYSPAPAKLFVIPGAQGVALSYLSPMVGQAAGATSDALGGSMFVVGPRISGHRMVIGLAPDGNRTVRVRLPGGHDRLVPVVDNVYAASVPIAARWMFLKNAAGRTVRLSLR
ncbi:MAG TPA: hypothetical protein VG405_14180 [Solirubrobacteraceae bacterium]|jgi:hypothetical protein|nr:hypothetical protein [Solirubrobacteraceae bacterium]